MTERLIRSSVAPKLPAIIPWALAGAVFLALQIYAYGAWMLSPDFRPTSHGPDPVPAQVLNIIRGYEIINSVIGVAALIWFVVGIVRTKRINTARLLMIGWLSAYWLDPWLDFLRPMFTYNAYAVNYGCWCRFMPFWQNPHGAHIAEPLLIDPSSYFYNFAAVAFLALASMRAVQKRWPATSVWVLGLAGFASIWVSMGILDIAATRYMGFDAWPIAFQRASLWGGHYYQFPIYEFVFFPAVFVACAFLLLRADASGETAIERGVGRFAGGATRALLRILAFIAFCNVLNLAYTTAMGVHALYGDAWPRDMPSWLANEQ